MQTPLLLANVSQFSTLVPLVAGLALWNRLDRALRILAMMFVMAAGTEAVSLYLVNCRSSNLWLGHLWTAVEIPCILLVFSSWQRPGRLRRFLRGAIPAYLLVLLLNKIFLETFDNVDSFSRPLGNILLVAAAVAVFQQILLEPGCSLRSDPRFWVSSAILIYHAGNLTLSTLGMFLLKTAPEAYATIYTVHSVINILTNLMCAAGFLCHILPGRSIRPVPTTHGYRKTE